MNTLPGHLSLETLLAYWLHESDPATTDAVDEHLMGCDACGQLLDEVIALGAGVGAAVRAGAVSAVISGAFLQRLAGYMQVREYRLSPADDNVNCTLGPQDQLLAIRLQAPLQGVTRLDVRAELSIAPGMPLTMEDVPFDRDTGEVLYLPKPVQIRQFPALTVKVALLAVEPGGTRELAHYAFHHQPWQGGAQPPS